MELRREDRYGGGSSCIQTSTTEDQIRSRSVSRFQGFFRAGLSVDGRKKKDIRNQKSKTCDPSLLSRSPPLAMQTQLLNIHQPSAQRLSRESGPSQPPPHSRAFPISQRVRLTRRAAPGSPGRSRSRDPPDEGRERAAAQPAGLREPSRSITSAKLFATHNARRLEVKGSPCPLNVPRYLLHLTHSDSANSHNQRAPQSQGRSAV